MSHSILYQPAFIKLSQNQYIPFYQNGDSNIYDVDWQTGKERRERNWSTCGSLFAPKGAVVATEVEMLQSVADYEADGSIQKNQKWLGGKELQRLVKNACKSAYTFEQFQGYHVRVMFKRYICDGDRYEILGKAKDEQEFFEIVNDLKKRNIIYFLNLEGIDYAIKDIKHKSKKMKVEPPIVYVVVMDGIYGCTQLTARRLKYARTVENGKHFKNEGSAINWAKKVSNRIKDQVFTVEAIKNPFYKENVFQVDKE